MDEMIKISSINISDLALEFLLEILHTTRQSDRCAGVSFRCGIMMATSDPTLDPAQVANTINSCTEEDPNENLQHSIYSESEEEDYLPESPQFIREQNKNKRKIWDEETFNNILPRKLRSQSIDNGNKNKSNENDENRELKQPKESKTESLDILHHNYRFASVLQFLDIFCQELDFNIKKKPNYRNGAPKLKINGISVADCAYFSDNGDGYWYNANRLEECLAEPHISGNYCFLMAVHIALLK
jgi:hypothetical protein